jgi:hypothetical protein
MEFILEFAEKLIFHGLSGLPARYRAPGWAPLVLDVQQKTSCPCRCLFINEIIPVESPPCIEFETLHG